MTRIALLLAATLTLAVWAAAARPATCLTGRGSRPLPSAPVVAECVPPPAPRAHPRARLTRRARQAAACLVFHDRRGLVASLASNVKERRRGALAAIRFLGPDAAPLAPEIAGLLYARSAAPEVFEALEVLGPHAAPAVGDLINALYTTRNRDHALGVLRAIGPAAAEARFAVLDGDQDFMSWWALESFGRAALDVAPRLVPRLREDYVARALAAIDPDGATLAAVRASDAPAVVLAELFGAWGAREEIPRLLRWLEQEDDRLRYEAACALDAMGAPEAASALLRLVRADPSPRYVDAVARLRPDLVPRLIPALVMHIEREEEFDFPAGPDVLGDFIAFGSLVRHSHANRAALSLGYLGSRARDTLRALEPRFDTVPTLWKAAARIDRKGHRDRALLDRPDALYRIHALDLRCIESVRARLRALTDPELAATAAWSLAQFEELPAWTVPALLDALPQTLRALGRVKRLPASCAPRLLALDWDDPEDALAAVARLEPAGRALVLRAVRR